MTLTIIKKSSKKLPIAEETGYIKIKRQGREQRIVDEKKIKDKQLAKKKEENHLKELVIPYLDKLEFQLEEKQLDEFWTFPDRSGFKKIKNISFEQMKKLIKQDVEKYAERKICLVQVSFQHNKPLTSVYRKDGILLIVTIKVYHIDNKGILNGKNITNVSAFNWTLYDFAITKITFKLLEVIMQIIVNNQYQSIGFSGLPIQVMIKELKQKKIDISDVLVPLSGC